MRQGPGWCPLAEQVEGVTPYGLRGPAKVGFCDHTAGGFYATLARASFWNGQGYSVHFGVGRDGRICQMVNIFDRAWGQGQDSRGPGYPVGPDSTGITWPPFVAMGKVNPNEYLISVEHEDAETVAGQTRFVPGSEWTRAQYLADLRLKHWCVDETRLQGFDLLRFGIDSLAGHHMFDPVNRAGCPGHFWRDVYRARLYADLTGGHIEEDELMTPLNGIAQWFEDREVAPGEGYAMQVRSDLSLPMQARMVRLDVYTASGPLIIRHPDLQVAGVIEADERHATVDVLVREDGVCFFDAPAGCHVRRIGALGYW